MNEEQLATSKAAMQAHVAGWEASKNDPLPPRPMDKTCMSWWFPKLEQAGVPQPKTILTRWPGEPMALMDLLDGKVPEGYDEFVALLELAVKVVGLPAFFRTGLTSGKHDWNRTCFLAKGDRQTIGQHVAALVEFSHMCDFLGLDHDIWAVREFLPCPDASLAFPSVEHGGMIVREEFRCFVSKGSVVCIHPYWPQDAFGDITERDTNRITEIGTMTAEKQNQITPIVKKAGLALDGDFSIDVLNTARGWVVTDCAVAQKSWHWPACPANKWKRFSNDD